MGFLARYMQETSLHALYLSKFQGYAFAFFLFPLSTINLKQMWIPVWMHIGDMFTCTPQSTCTTAAGYTFSFILFPLAMSYSSTQHVLYNGWVGWIHLGDKFTCITLVQNLEAKWQMALRQLTRKNWGELLGKKDAEP